MFNLTQGKSTFVSFLEEASNENKWEITKEPVSLWTKKINGETSLLEKYYTGLGSCHVQFKVSPFSQVSVWKFRHKNP